MRAEKLAIVDEIRSRLEDATFALLAGYKGLTVEQMSELRAKLREDEATMLVVKNAFLSRAAADSDWEEITSLLDGPLALVAGTGDVTAVAKALAEYRKANELPTIQGGMLRGRLLTSDDVVAMSRIPPREVLLGQVVGTIAAPMSGLVGVMKQKIASLVYCLKAIEEKKAAS
jgi:large subunit ribosomal protein L10